MISEHRPDVGPERSGSSVPGETGPAPRLDARGMPVERAARDGDAPARERGPSLLLPALVSAAGVLLAGFEVFSLVTMDLPEGEPLPLHRAVLSCALALGGFSVTRLLQLLVFASTRRRRRQAGQELAEVAWQLTDAHTVHGVWALGVSGSIALMGLLGLWSLLDGIPSGLEPGWPLLLVGGVLALLGRLAWLRTSACWEGAPEAF
ncbi:hypothetical protein [Brachybacterium massiliense]|uniref:hypothetical protein n=1 Tax=Brachybacterium massiliense TaxID=1755098 RepID=UPI00148386B1|nr:hypothetical protein [Brachybacterium massiliense]